jgi:hypothetical protein
VACHQMDSMGTWDVPIFLRKVRQVLIGEAGLRGMGMRMSS